MQTLTLDYSKWRCGGAEEIDTNTNVLGKGSTRLMNTEGFMCCLGQFALQLDFSKGEIMHEMRPCSLRRKMGEFNRRVANGNYYEDTKLSVDCIEINDNTDTTPAEKIKQLAALLAQNNIELKVINLPNDAETTPAN
jgi:hypothetical protein